MAEQGAAAAAAKQNFEPSEVKQFKTASDASAAEAKSSLSNNALDLMKEEHNNKAGKGETVTSQLSDKVSNSGKAEGSISGKLENQMPKDLDKELGKKMGDSIKHRLEKFPPLNKKVTDEDRQEAKDQLSEGLGALADKELAKSFKDLTGAAIDGNVDGLKKALTDLAGKTPEEQEKIMKEFNTQMRKNGSGLELSKDSQGNFLMYDSHKGETAISFDPKTGEASLKPIERTADGSIVVKPGEIINKTVADVARALGDDTTRDVLGLNFIHKFPPINRPYLEGKPGLPWNPSEKGGGGKGGGIPLDKLPFIKPTESMKEPG